MEIGDLNNLEIKDNKKISLLGENYLMVTFSSYYEKSSELGEFVYYCSKIESLQDLIINFMNKLDSKEYSKEPLKHESFNFSRGKQILKITKDNALTYFLVQEDFYKDKKMDVKQMYESMISTLIATVQIDLGWVKEFDRKKDKDQALDRFLNPKFNVKAINIK